MSRVLCLQLNSPLRPAEFVSVQAELQDAAQRKGGPNKRARRTPGGLAIAHAQPLLFKRLAVLHRTGRCSSFTVQRQHRRRCDEMFYRHTG